MAPVRIHFLLAMLIGLAMSLTPLAMPAAEAAAAPATHHVDMAEAGDCHQAPQAPASRDTVDKDCCIAGCMAVAAIPQSASLPESPRSERDEPRSSHFRRGHLSEIATPPPRVA